MGRHVALLRGINVGGHRRVAMPQLRALLEDVGYRDVATYVQSGNVVLSSDESPERVARGIERAIAGGLDLELDVVARSRDELAAAIEANPLPRAPDEPKLFQVTFLSEAPDPERAAAIEAGVEAPEQVAFSGREVYAYYAEGMQKSKLARRINDKGLGVTATARNWNTVKKLLEMADVADG